MTKKIGSYLLITIITVFAAKAQIKVINSHGETISFSSVLQEKSVVFLHKNATCIACKRNLGKFLKEHIDTNNITIHAVASILYSPSTYWLFDSEIRRICPKTKHVYFDYSSYNSMDSLGTNSDGLFGYYKIEDSPSLLLVNKEKTLLIKYKEIFEGYAVSETIKKMILDFFKN